MRGALVRSACTACVVLCRAGAPDSVGSLDDEMGRRWFPIFFVTGAAYGEAYTHNFTCDQVHVWPTFQVSDWV